MKNAIDAAVVFLITFILFAVAWGQQYTVTDLGPFSPTHITEFGVISALRWDVDGTSHNLNTLVALPSGWLLTEANGITDDGGIVAAGFIGSARHGFLLTPQVAPPLPSISRM